MLASIAWLKRYVDIDVTPEELADKLTRVGLEVESVIHQGQGISGVVTGKVTAIEKNPKSDHILKAITCGCARWITAAARLYRSRPAPRM